VGWGWVGLMVACWVLLRGVAVSRSWLLLLLLLELRQLRLAALAGEETIAAAVAVPRCWGATQCLLCLHKTAV
jgi:hypothetical protein